VAHAPGEGDDCGDPLGDGDGSGLGDVPGAGNPVKGWAHPASVAANNHNTAAVANPTRAVTA
jgi:hypothetical protein